MSEALHNVGLLFLGGCAVIEDHLYYLTDDYFRDFPDSKLMKNKQTGDGTNKRRPFFFALQDEHNSNIFWLIPISSKIGKYTKIANSIKNKYGSCNKILFGKVFGKQRAFLLQNICPATSNYIKPYLDKNNTHVRLDIMTSETLKKAAPKFLKKARWVKNLIEPNVLKIYKALEEQLKEEFLEQSSSIIIENDREI